ncbi:hypothetical protein BH10ACT1_BH10ACT1_13500 [soil metagenome]
MTEVYGSIAGGRQLLRKEREPLTGRLVRTRDQKGQGESSPPPARRAPRRALVAAGIVVLVVAAATSAVALTRGGPDEQDARNGGAAAATRSATGGGVVAAADGDAATTTLTDPPATAITVVYSGGTFTRKVCTDLLDSGACSTVVFDEFDPLTVRCTPEGCSTQFAEHTVVLSSDVSESFETAHSADPDDCAVQSFTLELHAVGSMTTHGIRHPARLTGRATNEALAEVLPTANCLGRSEVYEYDAVPQ